MLIYVHSKCRSARELKYWMTGTIKSSIKTKLGEFIQKTKDHSDIQDVAEKMGMTKCEVYLELWNQSTRNTMEDFKILMKTEDYKTIITQVKNTLKKECLSLK